MKCQSPLISGSLRLKKSSGNAGAARGVEALEPRQLLSVSVTPVQNAVIPQGSAPQTIDLSQVFTDNTTGVADLTFGATSDNTSLVQTTVNANQLTVAVTPSLSGFAHVKLSATAPDGSTASQMLRVQITATPSRTLTVVLNSGAKRFRFVESNNTIGTISLIGPGTATIVLGGDNLVQIGDHARGANQEVESISLSGTTTASRLFINGIPKERGALVAGVGNINVDGSLGWIRIKHVELLGDMTVTGGAGKITMDYAISGTITLDQSVGQMNVSVGAFYDENFSTPAPIGALQVGNWYDTDSVTESFIAPTVRNLFADGSFEVGLQLSGVGATGRTLNRMRVNGQIGGVWDIVGASAPLYFIGSLIDFSGTFASLPFIQDNGSFSGTLQAPALSSFHVGGSIDVALLNFTAANTTDLQRLTVRGGIESSDIVAAGNIGAISAEAVQGSIVYAGVGQLAQGQVLPQTVADLANTASIGSITLHPPAKVIGFLGSDVAATTIGRLALGSTTVDNKSVSFGIAATYFGRVTVRDRTNHQTIAFSDANNAAALAAQFSAQGINLQDFVIQVLS